MYPITVAVVVSGIGLAALVGYAVGLDLRAALTLAAIIGVGLLAVAGAAKSRFGRVGPSRCTSCEGLISPNAPHCKHCGTVL